MRDDFFLKTKELLAKRVANRCSNPSCRQITRGPHEDRTKAVNIGVAAHITAASEDGPRFDPSLTPNERRSAENGIWLCQSCAKLVDNDPIRYSADVLRQWKVRAEGSVALELEYGRGGDIDSNKVFLDLERIMPDILDETHYDKDRWKEVDGIPFYLKLLWEPVEPESYDANWGNLEDEYETPAEAYEVKRIQVKEMKARHLYVAGCINSIDIPNPSWGGGDGYRNFFMGDTTGLLRIAYHSGQVDTLPLVYGYTESAPKICVDLIQSVIQEGAAGMSLDRGRQQQFQGHQPQHSAANAGANKTLPGSGRQDDRVVHFDRSEARQLFSHLLKKDPPSESD